jgi:hypothetical protein
MRRLRPHILALALLVPALPACDGLFDLDINEDPNAATAVPGDLLMPYVLARLASTKAIEVTPSTSFHSQIWSANGSADVFYEPERGEIDEFTSGNTWAQFYSQALNNLPRIRDQALAAEPAQTNTAAQAEIMANYIYWMATALWGEVPFTQAGDGLEFPHPEFDDQETVLRGIVQRLDAAIALIDLTPDAIPGIGFGDLMYGGNMDGWRRFANSLKLRTLMMIRNRDTGVDAQIQALLSEPLIRDNVDEAAFPFFATTGNENNIWKLHTNFGGFNNAGQGNVYIFAGETLVDLMKELGDPRLTTYFAFRTNFSTGAGRDLRPDRGRLRLER